MAWPGTPCRYDVFWRNHNNIKGFRAFYLLIKLWDSSDLEENRVPAKIVLLVAIVAVSRKVIILDYKETSPGMLYGMSTLILALSGGYYLVRRAMHWKAPDSKSSSKD